MTIGRALLLAAVASLLLFPLPAPVVERAYSEGAYAVLQPLATSFSNAAPFALMDVAIGLALAAWLALGARDVHVGRRAPARAIARVAFRTVAWAAAAYLWFLLMWGLNYRRVRLVDRLAFDQSAVTEQAAARLTAVAVDDLNRLWGRAHADGWTEARSIDPALAGAFDRTVRDLRLPKRQWVVVGRPKHTVFDWYMRRAGVEGMTDPFLLETLVADDLLPFERPSVVAHEWSHLAGLADEGEANFAGWLTCVRGSPADQYSGWLFMYGELLRAIKPRDRAAFASRLAEGPRADLRAIRDRVARQVDPRLSSIGWRVYDSYLKANRIEAGAASYAEVVKLALGVQWPGP